MCGRLAIDCNGIDGVRRDTGLVQTGPDRFGRQPGPVFHAAKSFFLGGGNQSAVDHQCGAGIRMEGIQTENHHCSVSLS